MKKSTENKFKDILEGYAWMSRENRDLCLVSLVAASDKKRKKLPRGFVDKVDATMADLAASGEVWIDYDKSCDSPILKLESHFPIANRLNP